MDRPQMLLPAANSKQPPGSVMILFAVPDCRLEYAVNVSKISNTYERAKDSLPPSLTAYTVTTVEMDVICLYDPQPPYDGVARADIDFTGATSGDYLVEIYDEDENIYYGGVITID